jgi:hypothetical protein
MLTCRVNARLHLFDSSSSVPPTSRAYQSALVTTGQHCSEQKRGSDLNLEAAPKFRTAIDPGNSALGDAQQLALQGGTLGEMV